MTINPELRRRLAAADTYEAVVAHLADALSVPVALLDRRADTWQVRAHAHPASTAAAPLPEITRLGPGDATLTEEALAPWTAISIHGEEPSGRLLILPGPCEQWQTTAVQELMADVVSAIEHAALREDAGAMRKVLERTRTLSDRLSQLSDSQAPYDVVLQGVAEAVNAEVGALAVLAINDRTLTLRATYGYPAVLVTDRSIQPGEGILGDVLATGAPLLVTNVSQQYPRRPRRRRYRSESFAVLPLKTAGETIAVLSVTDRRDGRALDAADMDVLLELMPAASLAVARARLQEHVGWLQHLATEDPLTGLRNRRHFRERLQVEVARAHRHQAPLSVLLIDADNLKQINDSCGHGAGDAVLRGFAEVLRRTVRVFDVCARWGGDEFAVLMPGTDGPAAVHTAERIRRQYASLPLLRGILPPHVKLSVSIGAAVLQPLAKPDDLLLDADRALYDAKRAGGNMVRRWGDPSQGSND